MHDGADVDFFFGESSGNFSDDAGAIDDVEADVMGDFKLGADARGDGGNLNAARVMGESEQVADDGDRGGMSAGSVSGEDDIAAVVAGEDDHILSAARPGKRRVEIDEHGSDGSGDAAFDLLGAGDLADGAAEIAGVAEVDGGDRGDGLRHDLFRVDDDAHCEAHEDGELGAGIEAADIFSGVGLGVALCLGFSEHGGVFGTGVHFAEDEVAGAVEDAFDALDAIAGESLFEAGDDGNASGDGSAVLEVSAFGGGEALEFDALKGDELFIGGNDTFAGLKGVAHPVSSGVEATGEFDDDIDIGGEDGIGVFSPSDACGHPGDAFAGDTAIEDVGEFQSLRF